MKTIEQTLLEIPDDMVDCFAGLSKDPKVLEAVALMNEMVASLENYRDGAGALFSILFHGQCERNSEEFLTDDSKTTEEKQCLLVTHLVSVMSWRQCSKCPSLQCMDRTTQFNPGSWAKYYIIED